MRGGEITDLGSRGAEFPSTLWTAVLGCRDRTTPDYRDRLEHLVRLYWKPVYWFVRSRRQKSNEDAKDLTQEFFASFLEKDRLSAVGPEKGRFRTYLRVIVRNFLHNAEEAARAAKRGGPGRILSLNAGEGEVPIDAGTLPPDEFFDKAWAYHLIHEAAEEMARRYEAEGKEIYYRIFERHELAEEAPSCAKIAREFGLKLTDVENHLKHARASLSEILRNRVKETLLDGEDLDDELRALAEALRKR